MRSGSALVGVLVLLVSIGAGCTYGHQEAASGPFQPLVFPGEARLGASAFMVIDSNQFGIGDQLERYDLHRGNVEILIEGNLDTVPVDLRSVFTVETGRATDDAELRANSWVTIAFFDLPDTSGVFSSPYPRHAPLHVEVDNVEIDELEGVIWVIGEGGTPTSMDATPLLPLLEDALESRTVFRLRARAGTTGSNGFVASWTIGAITLDVDYDGDCLESPSVHLGSEAVGGSVTIGAPAASPLGGGMTRVRLVVAHPRGFQLPVAGMVDPTRLGSGPIVDIAFDRDTGCSTALDGDLVEVKSLKIHDRDGNLKVSRPSPGESATSFDASQYFHFHYLDPEAS